MICIEFATFWRFVGFVVLYESHSEITQLHDSLSAHVKISSNGQSGPTKRIFSDPDDQQTTKTRARRFWRRREISQNFQKFSLDGRHPTIQ